MQENRSTPAGLDERARLDPAEMTPAEATPTFTYIVYTDGACLGNPGPAGWAFDATRSDGKHLKRSGGLRHDTNNEAELTAVIEALQALKPGSAGIVRSDSRYVTDGVTKWRKRWETNGWRSRTGDLVKNHGLWWVLFDLHDERPGIVFEWVKGHHTDRRNIAADRLASEQAERQRRKIAAGS